MNRSEYLIESCWVINYIDESLYVNQLMVILPLDGIFLKVQPCSFLFVECVSSHNANSAVNQIV